MMNPSDYAVRPVLAAAILCLAAWLPAADTFAQGEPRDPGQLTAAGHGPGVRIWRKITIGARKGVDGYRDALEAASIKIGDDADEILGRPAFPYSKARLDLELAVISVAELGIEPSAASLSNVYRRAGQVGLELCPPEVGPQLRIDYRDQPRGEALHIAMLPVATYDGRPTIFALTNAGSGLTFSAVMAAPTSWCRWCFGSFSTSLEGNSWSW
jgi:hypothetical protein